VTGRNDFTRLKGRQHLLRALGIDEVVFDFILAFEPPPDLAQEPAKSVDHLEGMELTIPAFIRHKIPKKNKARGFRIAWEPLLAKSEYKALARRLTDFFGQRLTPFPHPAAFGYVSGRNIRENAAAHCGHKELLSVDVADFFGSISQARIAALFSGAGMGPEVCDLLSRFVTISGGLPLGLPTSPILSNAIFQPADVELQALSDAYGTTYTRYSDDLNFSSDGVLPPFEAIEAAVARHGFTLAAAKTRRSRRGQAHFVTGLSISERDQPHVPKRKKRELRQELYYARKFGLADHLLRRGVNDSDVLQQQINRLDGLVKFAAFHEPRLSSVIKPQWAGILRDADARVSYRPRGQNKSPFWISVDEAEFASSNGPMLALGLSVTQHQDQVVQATHEVLDDWLADLWAPGDRAALIKRGLHMAEAHPDLVRLFVHRLRTMPFEGYIAMGRLVDPQAYEATYLRLLGAIIRRRLMAAESEFVSLVVEANNKVSQDRVRYVVNAAQAKLREENNRRPRAVHVQFVTKPNWHVSVPDFLLGVLGRYLQSADTPANRPEARDRLLFESLRDKYRLILDVDDWREYSRRRPIRPWMSTVAAQRSMQ